MYVVINGGGKIGAYLANVLLKSGNEVAVIEQNRRTADRLSVELTGRYLIIHGDGCDSKFQEDAGIRHADVFVATTGQDDSNLVSCEIAQRVFSVPRCIARVNSPKNMRIFHEVGIESVSSTTLIANMIEEEALMGSVSVVSSLTHGNVALSEVTVPRMRYHSNADGVLARDILQHGQRRLRFERARRPHDQDDGNGLRRRHDVLEAGLVGGGDERNVQALPRGRGALLGSGSRGTGRQVDGPV